MDVGDGASIFVTTRSDRAVDLWIYESLTERRGDAVVKLTMEEARTLANALLAAVAEAASFTPPRSEGAMSDG